MSVWALRRGRRCKPGFPTQVERSTCDFVVDFERNTTAPLEPNFRTLEGFTAVHCEQFLDAQESHPLGRAFYWPNVPILRHKFPRVFRPYCLYQQTGRGNA